jgi:23S rRNA (pseudouridine1915-N3)-methyltransferase
MKILVSLHGKPKDKRVLEILEEYKQKVSRYQKIELVFIDDFKTLDVLLEKRGSKDKKIYLLDEDGKDYDSSGFAKNYAKDLDSGVKEVEYIIGPAQGFGDIKQISGINTISLSKLALQHDIASIVLIEQIYRAVSIHNNLPYHRA